VSPFEKHDPNLGDLQLGGSGQKAPEADGPDSGDGPGGDGPGADGAPTEAEVVEEVIQEELVEEEAEREAVKAGAEAGHGPGALKRLYRGETSFDFVGRRRWWFLLSSLVIVAGLASLGIRGFNLGITFKGGTAWRVQSNTLTQPEALKVAQAAGLNQPTVEVLGHGGQKTVEVTADLKNLTTAQRTTENTKVEAALAKAASVSVNTVSHTFVGPTWGSQVTQKAVIALIVFFVVVAVYISLRFEPKMAVAAFVALLHDLLVTAGVYSLAGFQVTPDTVIAVLTILGYSLYDTVVVFTRVRDNSKGLGATGRMTYSEMINLSMNQTLARSINTSMVAILPVLSVLVIGAEFLGATTLQDYGLALTVGLISGAYSSIFIASPVLAMLKEREPRYATIRQRLESRGDRAGLLTPAAAALAMAGAGPGSTRASKAAAGRSPGTLRPGTAKGGSRPKAGASAASAKGATGSPSPQGAAAAAGGARPTAGTGARRPPPRPRKGGGKGKSRKRR
jgi:preprotein translocase subunit SecF